MLVDPVVGEKFFGRQEVLAILEKRISALKSGYRQNIALTGHRLTGKSSILNQFLFNFSGSGIMLIYLEVIKEPFKHFAGRFIGMLLYNFLKYKRKKAKDDLDFLVEECRDFIPQTVQRIEAIFDMLKMQDNDGAYSELLNLTSVIKDESGILCVVMLDEFHNLSRLSLKDPFRGFGKKIMTQKDTLYIVASSEVSKIKKILSEKLALLFGNFEKLTIAGFDVQTSKAFLQKKFAGLEVDEELMDFIISFADGHPFYLDVLSSKIINITDKKRMLSVGQPVVIDTLEELLYSSRGTFNQFFANLLRDILDTKKEGCKETLIALAHGIFKQRELAKWTGAGRKEIPEHIDILQEANLIFKTGNVYRFYDKLLKFWLRRVYHKRRTTLVGSISERTDNFRAEADDMIRLYLKNRLKSDALRIKELIDSFDNEIVEINSKKRRLQNFDATEIAEEAGERYIKARKGDSLSLFHIPAKKADEYCIMEFLTYSLKYKPNLQRRVIIPLHGIEINATILAKELKIWIWDKGVLDELFDIYEKNEVAQMKKERLS